MCEKFFNHVGQFKDHATKHAMKIVDAMHDPNVNSSNKHAVAQGIVPLEPNEIKEDYRVLLDEDDVLLYSMDPNDAITRSPSSLDMYPPRHSGFDGSMPVGKKLHKIYAHDNIIFKFTHKS